METEIKHWTKSTTIWLNGSLATLGAAIAGIAQDPTLLLSQLGNVGISPTWVARVGLGLFVIGTLNINRRFKTTTGITMQKDTNQ